MIIPSSVEDAVAHLAEHPAALILAGGTDAMVEINDGHRRPDGVVVTVNRIPELRSWRHDPVAGTVAIGAAVTYTELAGPRLAALVPALAEASRTVGSPQIRNAGTLGGNLGTCSPAGDGLPVLSALDATATLVSVGGTRTVSVHDFMVGPKRTALAPGELLTEITVPVLAGWQGYAKVGVRNAMVIAVAGACLVLDTAGESVRLALGSVGPTILRCRDAEADLAGSIDWRSGTAPAEAVQRFGRLAAQAARPITDHRSSAEYRRHAVGVLAQRLARRATSQGKAA